MTEGKAREDLIRHLKLLRLFGPDFIPGPGADPPRTGAPPAETQSSVGNPGEGVLPADPGFEEFRRNVLACTKCRLRAGCRQVVFGSGNLQARVMLVGEAPGEEEDVRGEPFVGRAGRLLTSILERLGVRREQIYITNIVKCRPPENRIPQEDEIRSCIPYLLRQMRYIRPQIVCALGRPAAAALLNRPHLAVLSERGKYYEAHGARIFVTVHPAYCLRNPADTRLLEQDLSTVLRDADLGV